MKPATLILAAVFIASPSLACAPAAGEGRFVRVDAEDAVIIWDGPAKREHFIRRALFDTDAKDFGFLVPTPEKPEIGEADDVIFARLADIVVPPQARNLEAAPAGTVTVLEQKVVAGLDATVLEATDANALFDWLKEHGYHADADLLDWTRPYVERGWKITAFKIAAGAPKVATKAVRMSFQTERPFFPYREPASQRSTEGKRARLLRVYFLANARFDGMIGGKDAWPGRTVFSQRIDDEQRLELLKLAHLPIMAGGGGRWLTKFEDHASPRPGTDEVYFARAADQSAISAKAAEPPSRFSAGLTTGAILFLLAAGVGYSVRRFLKRSHG